MKVYLASEQDWVDFVNGKTITSYLAPIENYFKEILVAFNEVVSVNCEQVSIVKMY